jgi:hypothetical protein
VVFMTMKLQLIMQFDVAKRNDWAYPILCVFNIPDMSGVDCDGLYRKRFHPASFLFPPVKRD